MIFYYSNDSIAAQLFVGNLEFFLNQELQAFGYDELREESCDLLIIDDQDLHPQKLKKIINHYTGCPVILISDRKFKNPDIMTIVSSAVPLRDVADICYLVFDRKISKKSFKP